jgi:hypothetical protein
MESLDQEWLKFRPDVERYHEASIELQEAILANNQSDIEQWRTKMGEIAQKISNL